jgi:hypothetical protein
MADVDRSPHVLSESSVPIARRLPEHDQRPTDDPVALKAMARRAWQEARARSALPVGLVDRLWAEGLIATRQAPPNVALIMMHRTAVFFALLRDRAGWLDHEESPSPPPRS